MCINAGGAITKVAGSVFGGTIDSSAYKKNESVGPVETGPTSIQIQLEKNSDDSDEEDESEKKQLVCCWLLYVCLPCCLCGAVVGEQKGVCAVSCYLYLTKLSTHARDHFPGT